MTVSVVLLRFRRSWAPLGSPDIFDGNGQLIAVDADAERVDKSDIVAISRPNVRRRHWKGSSTAGRPSARLTEDIVNLSEIRSASTPPASTNSPPNRVGPYCEGQPVPSDRCARLVACPRTTP